MPLVWRALSVRALASGDGFRAWEVVWMDALISTPRVDGIYSPGMHDADMAGAMGAGGRHAVHSFSFWTNASFLRQSSVLFFS